MGKLRKTRRLENLVAIFAIVSIGLFFNAETVKDFPKGIHAWAQADHYALAKGFVRNDLNFFKPETYTLNHQFPHDWKVAGKESITAVDFPIHNFIPAVFMKIFGVDSPWIFRVYTFLYSFLGLFFLYKLSRALSESALRAMIVVLMAACSPVFIHYQNGFLPIIPSLANTCVGLYFYFRYLKSDRAGLFNVAILFLTMAALSRTTFAIPLIAALGVEFLRFLRGRSSALPKLFPVGLSAASILFYVWYNGHLRNTYGSIFLNHIKPATSLVEFREIGVSVLRNWWLDYFSLPQYVAMLLAMVAALSAFLLKRNKPRRVQMDFAQLVALMLIGCSAFALLMFQQYRDHDYYFLDTFYLPLLLVFAICLSAIPKPSSRGMDISTSTAVGLVAVALIISAKETTTRRRTLDSRDRIAATTANFTGADQFLDSLGVDRDAHILVIDAYAPAIPLILMDRKGFVVLTTSTEQLIHSLKFDFDYVVVQNQFFLSDTYENYPQVVKELDVIGNNGKITLAQRSEDLTSGSLPDFLGFDFDQPLLEAEHSFESDSISQWENAINTSAEVFSGNASGLVSPSTLYAMTYRIHDFPQLSGHPHLLMIEGQFFPSVFNEIHLVLSINVGDSGVYYAAQSISNRLVGDKGWQKLEFYFHVPLIHSKENEMVFYIYNPQKAHLFIDDYGFTLF